MNKDSYESFIHYIDLSSLKETSRELHYLYLTLVNLHEKYKKDFSVDDLAVEFFATYPDADKELYSSLFKQLQELQIDPDVGQGALNQIKRRRELLKLSETAFRVAQGLAKEDDLQAAMKVTVDHQPIEEENYFVTTDLEQLVQHVYKDQGLRWRLECLNKSLGSLRPGDFGFIFARPETGKTTFLASEATKFLEQTNKKIIWFNNEEDPEKVMMRVVQAVFGATKEQVMSNVARYRAEFYAVTDGRFLIVDDKKVGPLDRRFIEKVVEKHDPGLVIYDQLPKIKGFSADRKDLELGAIFQWARELAKRNHAAIGVSQADGTAEGVRYLTMDHVANAKTAVQAEADWILGIGKTHEQGAEYIRYLNISKNKLTGDVDSLEEFRHGRFEVLLKPEIARYEDVIRFE